MLYLIGCGINGFKSMPIEGLNACKKAGTVFLERYTGLLSDEDFFGLKNFIGKDIIELSRHELESGFEKIVLKKAKKFDAALLVVGDPLAATTHIEFLKSCKENNVDYKVIHASSIYSSVCETGLFVYRFGKSCSIPYFEKNFNPTSFFDTISFNYKNNAHTIVFLDIKSDLNKYMTIREGLRILLNISLKKNGFLTEDSLVIGVSRLGFLDAKIKFGSVKKIMGYDFGRNPHLLIIPNLNEIEKEYVSYLYS